MTHQIIAPTGIVEGTIARTFRPPSVCRIVEYRTRGTSDDTYPTTIVPAIVSAVHEDGIRITATVFAPTGQFIDELVPYSESYEEGTWSWPHRV